MSVTAPQGFRASGVAAGLKSSGACDVALVVNDGPRFAAAGVFTTNTVVAAPVIWTRQVLAQPALRAVVLNSGGANACTGPDGFADTHRTAEHTAADLGLAPIDIAVCSTGLIGVRLDLPALLAGIDAAVAELSSHGGQQAAEAIMTTDSVPKQVQLSAGGATLGGMAKGAGMLAPGMATMLAVLTTDAQVDEASLQPALARAVDLSFNRIDADGCMSTNDTVLVMANGASGVRWSEAELTAHLTTACAELARQMIADAEGATKEIEISVTGAASETEAVAAARAVAASNLFKCAMFGEDPNWGRILAAIGTSSARFDPNQVTVWLNGVPVCQSGCAGADPATVDLSGRHIDVRADLAAGTSEATVWTNDLSHGYVHENSAYST